MVLPQVFWLVFWLVLAFIVGLLLAVVVDVGMWRIGRLQSSTIPCAGSPEGSQSRFKFKEKRRLGALLLGLTLHFVLSLGVLWGALWSLQHLPLPPSEILNCQGVWLLIWVTVRVLALAYLFFKGASPER
jgi:hypothetical protein